MKPRVVILSFHGFGHINAYFKLASILKNSDYDVHFAGTGYFSEYVSSQGFPYHILKSLPFGLGLETWANTQKKQKHIYLSALRDRMRDALAKEREADLYWMLEELKPQFVLIDSFQASDFILLYKFLKARSIKVAILHAMLPLSIVPGRPPMNSESLPHDTLAVKRALRLLKWKHFKKAIKKKIIWFGFDEKVIIRRGIRKNSVPDFYVSKRPSLLNVTIQKIDEFIVAPSEFDFPDLLSEPTKHYVGFMINEDRKDQKEHAYEVKSPTIFNLKLTKNLKLIYCSFGTIEPKGKKIIFSFLGKLIHLATVESFLLIISLKAYEEFDKFQLSENVFIFNSVPQLEVLSRTDVFITHGGINSIKEAIHAEVPMLMYPIHDDYDPKGNAARVVYHGLGLRGDAKSNSEDEIKEKIRELLINPLYKRNVQELKRKNALYTPDKFLAAFKSIKPLL